MPEVQTFTDFLQFKEEMVKALKGAFGLDSWEATKVLPQLLYSILGTSMILIRLAEKPESEEYKRGLASLSVLASHLPEATSLRTLVARIEAAGDDDGLRVNSLEELRLTTKFCAESIKKRL